MSEMIYLLQACRRSGRPSKIVGLYPTKEEAYEALNDLRKAKPKHVACIGFGMMQRTTKTSRYWRRSFKNQPKPLYL